MPLVFLSVNIFLDNGSLTGIIKGELRKYGGSMPEVVRIEIDKAIADKAKPLLKRSGLTITSYVRVQLLDFIGGIETPIKKTEDNAESDISSLM